MNTLVFTTSVKKELWEFNKTLFWVPIIIAALVIAAPLIQWLLLEDYQVTRLLSGLEQLQTAQEIKGLDKFIFGIVHGLAGPFAVIAFIIQLYYFTTCFFDEKRDLSVYFWRSLPVSDAATVAVKFFTGAFMIPVIFMLGALATILILAIIALFACAVLAIGFDISVWHLWAYTDLFTNLSSIWLSIVPFVLWMLPVYAWLMLASIFAQKAPFLWAVLPVGAILVVEEFVVNYFHLPRSFFLHLVISYFDFDMHTLPHDFIHGDNRTLAISSALLSKVSLGGTLFSAALLYATYWVRVNNKQIN